MILALTGKGPGVHRICGGRRRVHISKEVKIKSDRQMKIKIRFSYPESPEQQELL